MGIPHRQDVTDVFFFDQLSETAKERAREWYRSCNDDGGHEYLYDRTLETAEMLGISIDTRRGSSQPAIYFSGFCSQGDGASWHGSYAYRRGSFKAIEAEWPLEVSGEVNVFAKEIQRIAKALQDVQRKRFYKLEARSTAGSGSNFYSHSNTMSVDVELADYPYRDINDAEEEVRQLMRDFADWIYSRLEAEHDWLNSDEVVDENITANEYEFDAEGRRV